MNGWTIVAVALGSALGGLMRYVAQSLSSRFIILDFPVGTLLVNVVGCCIAGFLVIYWHSDSVNALLKSAVLIGFLGALTTFSAFSVDTLSMLQSNEWLKASLNVSLNVILSLIAVFFGAWIGGRIAQP